MNGIARLVGPREPSPSPSGCPCLPARLGRRGGADLLLRPRADILAVAVWQPASAPGYQGENVISFIGVIGRDLHRPVLRFPLGRFPGRPPAAGGSHVLQQHGVHDRRRHQPGRECRRLRAPRRCRTAASGSPGRSSAWPSAADTSGVVARIQSVEPNPPVRPPSRACSTDPGPPLRHRPLDVSRPILLGPASQNGGQDRRSTPSPSRRRSRCSWSPSPAWACAAASAKCRRECGSGRRSSGRLDGDLHGAPRHRGAFDRMRHRLGLIAGPVGGPRTSGRQIKLSSSSLSLRTSTSMSNGLSRASRIETVSDRS